MLKDIVLLTKSTKFNGYCVAGIDKENGEWIRLTEFNEPSVVPGSFRYADGREPEVLDTIRVNVVGPDPTPLHPEDVLFDPTEIIPVQGRDKQMIAERVSEDFAEHGYVYHNHFHKLLYDKMPQNAIDSPYSLMIIEPEDLRFIVIESGDDDDRKIKIHAEFDWKGNHYRDLRVTDPVFEEQHKGEKPSQKFQLSYPAYLVISLGEKFFNPTTDQDEYYKLVASVIDKRAVEPMTEPEEPVPPTEAREPVPPTEAREKEPPEAESADRMPDPDMNKKACMILEQIAMGTDPYTGEPIGEESVFNRPDTIRSLFMAVNALKEKAHEKPRKPRGRKHKQSFHLTDEEKKQIEFSNNALPISRFIERLNDAKSDPNMKRLGYKVVVSWLMDNGYLEETIMNEKKFKIPTSKGKDIGIYVETRVTTYNAEYYVVMYDLKAQHFIVDRIDEITRVDD